MKQSQSSPEVAKGSAPVPPELELQTVKPNYDQTSPYLDIISYLQISCKKKKEGTIKTFDDFFVKM